MPVLADIKQEITDLLTFKHISAAFTEAAAVKLKNLRRLFEQNARFYKEITYIYHLVEVNAKKLKLEEDKKKTPTAVRQLSVAMTSNMRFFGNLNAEIIKTLILQSQKDKSDRLVIGKTGIDYLRSVGFREKYEKQIFAKDMPTTLETNRFFEFAKNYDRVLIFYPKFISFLTQTVGIVDITQKEKLERETEEEISLIFEPELSKMVKFFDNQVRLLLFQRVLLETEVSRTAARLLTMSQAEEHADHGIKSKKTELKKVERSIINEQLLDTFSGIKKWKH